MPLSSLRDSLRVSTSAPVRLAVEDKLEALRKLDPNHQWDSLDDQRYCTRCDHIITGRQIEVAGGTRAQGPLRLECPTQGCPATPAQWTAPGRQRRVRDGNDDVATADRKAADRSRVEIRGESEHISVIHDGRAPVVRRTRSVAELSPEDLAALQRNAPRRSRFGRLTHNIASIATDCRSLLGLLRPAPRSNFYPIH